MTIDAAHAPGGRRDDTLLRDAVHRHEPLSRAGLDERLFTLAFSGMVYAQIWEDPEVDLAAMEIEPTHRIIAIASGGCNVLSYLAADPAHVLAVDLNRAHVALTKLKLAGIRHLPTWEDFFRFFGEADRRSNPALFGAIEPHLDAETKAFWRGRSITGRRRLSMFAANIYRRGLLGRFIGAGHVLARLHGIDLGELMRARSLPEQRDFFETRIAPLFERRLVRWLVRRRATLFGLGIPPAQYDALAGPSGDMGAVLRQRLERLVCDFPLGENYFAWQAFNRGYARDGSGPLPPYLQRANHEKIARAAARVDVVRTSFTTQLASMADRSLDRYVLLDAQDWMNPAQLTALWSEIGRTAKPGARVIFRTAGEETILPGRVPDDILGRWRYEAERSVELGRRDRSAIYGGFHLYVLRAHA